MWNKSPPKLLNSMSLFAHSHLGKACRRETYQHPSHFHFLFHHLSDLNAEINDSELSKKLKFQLISHVRFGS